MKKLAYLFIIALTLSCNTKAQDSADKNDYDVEKTEAQWKAQLSDQEYRVLRKAATEPPYSSPLLDIQKPGTFVCKACEVPLYKTKYKFDSGTGWPSFDRGIDKNLELDVDHKLGYARTEVKCANCGSHLGHLFDDGPRETTGKRHCINGVALKFIPDGK